MAREKDEAPGWAATPKVKGHLFTPPDGKGSIALDRRHIPVRPLLYSPDSVCQISLPTLTPRAGRGKMRDMDLTCRCIGRDRATPCENPATEEDGLCDSCRHDNGSCEECGICGGPLIDSEYMREEPQCLTQCDRWGRTVYLKQGHR